MGQRMLSLESHSFLRTTGMGGLFRRRTDYIVRIKLTGFYTEDFLRMALFEILTISNGSDFQTVRSYM